MTVSVNWATKVITIPQADLTLISGSLYELDIDALRLELKDLEDSEEGMAHLRTHNHNTQVTLSGVTYARVVEFINGYTFTFQDVGTPYTVRCVGANHNMADVKNVNQVSLIIGNSAGLITVSSGSGLSASQDSKLTAINAQLIDIETGYDHNELMRLMAAVLAGKVSGAGTGTEVFRDINDTKDRVTVSTDSNGNRTDVARDAT